MDQSSVPIAGKPQGEVILHFPTMALVSRCHDCVEGILHKGIILEILQALEAVIIYLETVLGYTSDPQCFVRGSHDLTTPPPIPK